jgi:hypothetical protein
MKTAMQEIVEILKEEYLLTHESWLGIFEDAINKEKKQIFEAYDSGWNNGYRKSFDGGKKYYETTYQNTKS